jgi:two-component system sensor kinase FixL
MVFAQDHDDDRRSPVSLDPDVPTGAQAPSSDRSRQRQPTKASRRVRADRVLGAPLTAAEQIAASVVHEVNQPLAAIALSAAACLRWLGKDQPRLDEARRAAERILTDISRAREIIIRIRALALRSSSAMIELDINGVVEEILDLVEAELRQHDIVLTTELSANLPNISGDPVLLRQLVMNLAMNGIEAMSDIAHRPCTLRVRTQLGTDGNILVEIEDSGAGFDPATMDRIFDPLFTTKPHGMGMGLSICRSIIEAHRGRLWASSNSLHGSIFCFTLPALAKKIASAPRANERKQSS